jgi:hypothetical protein
MSATAEALTYWGQFPRQWGTSTTTMDTARRNPEAEDRSQNPEDVVLFVAPSETAFAREDRKPWYRASSLSPLLPRMFILEVPSGTLTVTSTAQSFVGASEVDPRAWRGIFPIHPTRNILFSETVEVRTETLRRLSPRIRIDRRTSEREDA